MSAMLSRRPVSLACLLTRAAGSPITARTTELGATGMRVVTARPLALDETVDFQLGDADDAAIAGRARVVCQERPDAYMLRFAAVAEPMARRLQDVVAASPQAGSASR